jgi:hypothetical protein
MKEVRKMLPFRGSDRFGEIHEVSDLELEKLVYDVLESMEYHDIQELCRALEVICCDRRPVLYH